MKEKKLSFLEIAAKLVLYGLIAFAIFTILKGCDSDYAKKQTEREKETIYNFMDAYGNPWERVLEDTAGVDDLRYEFQNGYIDIDEVFQAYEELQNEVSAESRRWENQKFKMG